MEVGAWCNHHVCRSGSRSSARLARRHCSRQSEPDTWHVFPGGRARHRSNGKPRGPRSNPCPSGSHRGSQGQETLDTSARYSLGAGLGFFAVLATWFATISIVSDLTVNYGALELQTATGMFAVIVILIEMDWFFHGVYWSNWINVQDRSKWSLIGEAGQLGKNSRRILLGLVLVGFAPVYREGFEVVLFLQSYYLEMGPRVVYYGAAAGLALTVAVGYLTFLGQRHLPYKKMLIATGVLLTGVLFVMVGEEVSEMQLAGWIGPTNIPWLQGVPAWAESWFSIFPNVQTFVAQALALLSVAGSFFFLRYRMWKLIQKSKSIARVASHNIGKPKSS